MDKRLLELEKQADELRNEGKYEEAIAKLKEALEIDESFVRGTSRSECLVSPRPRL